MPRLIKFHIPVKSLFIVATIIAGLHITSLHITSLYAQQSPQFSQYTMNEFLINPAVAGVDGRTILSMTARKDWVGFSDGITTPQTYAISIQSRILKSQYNISSNKGGGNKLKKQSKIKIVDEGNYN